MHSFLRLQMAIRCDRPLEEISAMKNKSVPIGLVLTTITIVGSSLHAQAQQQPPQSPNMTFFVTSNGPGKGADLGGLEGADRHCQTLAQAAGAGGKTWRAYL